MTKSEQTLAIAMWDFSWLERRWSGAGYENWDRALDELSARGYNAVRIDAYPHLTAINPEREWELLPVWNQHDWGSPALNRVRIQPALNDFIRKCAVRQIKVGLSSWFREDRDDTRQYIPNAEQHGAIWVRTLDTIAQDGLLDSILYVDLCNEWPLDVWAPFYRPEGARDWRDAQAGDWMRRAIETVRTAYPTLQYCFSFSERLTEWQGVDLSFFDLLEPHLWMANSTSFYRRVGYNFERFDPGGYEQVVRHAEKLYRAAPDHWLTALATGIRSLATWSDETSLPLITTECWALVDYKDWPLLQWDWVKDICAFGVREAKATGKWRAIATSNFCGPQFHGMWDDVTWHQQLTARIRGTAIV